MDLLNAQHFNGGCLLWVCYLLFSFLHRFGNILQGKKKTDSLKLIMTFTYISPKERQKSLLLLKKTPFQPHKKT